MQTKFEALAGYIESNYDNGGMDAVMIVPAPLINVLYILHEAVDSDVPEVLELVDELFLQLNANVGPTFSFDEWGADKAAEGS